MRIAASVLIISPLLVSQAGSVVTSDSVQIPGSTARVSGMASGQIKGVVFDDVDHDGLRDGGEPGIYNWRVVLSGTLSEEIRTDDEGRYLFAGLDSGNYVVTVFAPGSWTVTYPAANFHVLSLARGAARDGMDFGWGFPWNSITGMVLKT